MFLGEEKLPSLSRPSLLLMAFVGHEKMDPLIICNYVIYTMSNYYN